MRVVLTALALAGIVSACDATAAQEKKAAAVYTATVKIDDV